MYYKLTCATYAGLVTTQSDVRFRVPTEALPFGSTDDHGARVLNVGTPEESDARLPRSAPVDLSNEATADPIKAIVLKKSARVFGGPRKRGASSSR